MTNETEVSAGTLYLVATPIGNLGDFTPRAAAVLSAVDVIAAEDTRTTRQLLRLVEVATPAQIISYHDHNAATRAEELVSRLKEGASIALVSDAGTPCLSDPGLRLVRAAADAGHPVVPVPGPCAFLAALVTSGLPTDRFTFAGFLPHKPGKRRAALETLLASVGTLIFYEAPTRVVSMLRDAQQVLGDRTAAVHREITKRHEEVLRGPLSEISQTLADRARVKGEICVVIAGAPSSRTPEEADARRLVDLLRAEDLSPAAIKRVVSALTGLRKREVHSLLEDLP
jgi:16S rRNA (cytidine1402-2'-O)-methyltransferase